MTRKALSLTLVLALGGCASSEPAAPIEAEGPPQRTLVYEHDLGPRNRAGEVAVSVVGTPFLLVFKTAVCAGSLVIAGPAAALFTLAEGPHSQSIESLGEGIAKNCGPPYVLTPRGG